MAALEVMRSETKHLMSRREAARLSDRLKVIMSPDAYNADGSYTVRSLYFDTPENDDVFDKDVGTFSRRKIRLRIYDTNQPNAKLELKEKKGGVQRKRSVWVTKALAQRLAKGDLSVLRNRGDALLDELYVLMSAKLYRPSVVVEYERKALTYPPGNVRVTFDSDVRACRSNFDLFDPDMQFVSVFPDVVTEIKYTGYFPEALSDIISDHCPIRDSVSKYFLSAEEFD